MKLRSSKKTIAAVASTLVLTGMVAFAAGVNPTDDVNEKESKKLTTEDKTNQITKEIASVELADHQMVMEAAGFTSVNQAVEDSAKKADDAKSQIAYPEYADKFMTNAEDTVNIRLAADGESEIVGKLYAGAGGTVIERGAEWTKIRSGNVEGYIATQFLVFGDEAKVRADEIGSKTAKITADNIRVRAEASENSEILGLADINDVYTAGESKDGWVQINFDGTTGYVSSEYATVTLEVGTAISIEEEQEKIRLEEEERQAQIAAEEAARAEAAKEEAEKEAQRKRQAQEEEEQEEVSSKSQTTETVQTAAHDVSVDDSYLLACLVEAEAGGEPYEGKLAVANVVLNRVAGYGSISNVIYAPGQFSVVRNGRLDRALSNGPSAQSQQAANDALSGTNNVPNYTFFCMTSVANYSRIHNYTIIGTQIFYN